MNTLTFTDIFIGDNGIVVLISSMIIALAGNLFKKYQRYNKTKHNTLFSIRFWAKDNADDMVVAFFVTYILVRLLNVVTPYALSAAGIDTETSNFAVSDLLVIVSVFIGYYTDNIIERLIPKKD